MIIRGNGKQMMWEGKDEAQKKRRKQEDNQQNKRTLQILSNGCNSVREYVLEITKQHATLSNTNITQNDNLEDVVVCIIVCSGRRCLFLACAASHDAIWTIEVFNGRSR
jgi:hypothetical protein